MNFVPSLTRNQWLWLGGAAALGVTEVVSAPIAVALAALPILDNLATEDGAEKRSRRSVSDAPRRAPRRRRTTSRRRRTPASV